MKKFINKTPLIIFIILALTLGLAPFYPEPHLVEKIRMLANGTLSRPLDIFDLLLHAFPWILLVYKLALSVNKT